jgi:hypothetical protein
LFEFYQNIILKGTCNKLCYGKRLEGVGINGSLWKSNEFVGVTLRLISTVVIMQRLHILNNLPANIALDMDPWKKLPTTVTLNGKIIFKGFVNIPSTNAKPP